MGANKPANWGAEVGSGGATAGVGGGGRDAVGGAVGGAGLAAAVTVALAVPRGLRCMGSDGVFGKGTGAVATGARLVQLTVSTRPRAAGPGEEESNGLGFTSRWAAIMPTSTPWAVSDTAIAAGSARRKRRDAGWPAAMVAGRAK